MPCQPAFDPKDIERRSLQIIDSEVPEPRPYSGAQWSVVRRMIHASADFELLNLVRFHELAIPAGLKALRSGCKIFTDTNMCLSGITTSRLQHLGCETLCLISGQDCAQRAAELHLTRAAAAVHMLQRRLAGNIYVLGNAPTALRQLLLLLEHGCQPPALVIGMPVGFVDARESKQALLEQELMPYITVQGRKGGSPMAAACLNALAELALEDKER
ncbi:MAG: precorrin-8X methylmutase [Desulfohalobiaceae bacterium]